MKRSRLNTVLTGLVIAAVAVWLIVPFGMALLWSLVDPGQAWSYPDILPPKLSFGRWVEMWQTTSLSTALMNSYSLAPMAGLCTVLLAMPTAYAFGRLEFRGKSVAQVSARTRGPHGPDHEARFVMPTLTAAESFDALPGNRECKERQI